MNEQEAKTFNQRSETNAMILVLTAQASGCGCEPYVDWFTYRRWQAQGFQVQKGEKATKLQTYRPIVKEDENGKDIVVGSRPWTSHVFCRCQVEEKGDQWQKQRKFTQ